jgi:transcriptional regulator with XRE-family HTH domain
MRRRNDKLRDARTRAGLTQAEVAQVIGKSQVLVSAWEMGRANPSIDDLTSLVRLYEVRDAAALGYKFRAAVERCETPS